MHQWNQRKNMFPHLHAKIPYITMIQSYFSSRDEFLWPNAFSNWFLSRRYKLRSQNIAAHERSIIPFSITKQFGPRSFNLIFIESFLSAVRGKDILTAPALFPFLVSNSFFPLLFDVVYLLHLTFLDGINHRNLIWRSYPWLGKQTRSALSLLYSPFR